jgi:hypothetical protein
MTKPYNSQWFLELQSLLSHAQLLSTSPQPAEHGMNIASNLRKAISVANQWIAWSQSLYTPSIPTEILSYIAGFNSKNPSIQQMSRVCKQWQSLVSTEERCRRWMHTVTQGKVQLPLTHVMCHDITDAYSGLSDVLDRLDSKQVQSIDTKRNTCITYNEHTRKRYVYLTDIEPDTFRLNERRTDPHVTDIPDDRVLQSAHLMNDCMYILIRETNLMHERPVLGSYAMVYVNCISGHTSMRPFDIPFIIKKPTLVAWSSEHLHVWQNDRNIHRFHLTSGTQDSCLLPEHAFPKGATHGHNLFYDQVTALAFLVCVSSWVEGDDEKENEVLDGWEIHLVVLDWNAPPGSATRIHVFSPFRMENTRIDFDYAVEMRWFKERRSMFLTTSSLTRGYLLR